MRAEKTSISEEYIARLKASPYFIAIDYAGLKVGPITELRKRLAAVTAELHVVKKSIFRIAAKESGIESDLAAGMVGQVAVVTGQKDIAGAAKILKNFHAEFERPAVLFGVMGDDLLDAASIKTLADLPPLNELRARLIGLINTPATRLAQVLQAPAGQLARVLKAKAEKG